MLVPQQPWLKHWPEGPHATTCWLDAARWPLLAVGLNMSPGPQGPAILAECTLGVQWERKQGQPFGDNLRDCKPFPTSWPLTVLLWSTSWARPSMQSFPRACHLVPGPWPPSLYTQNVKSPPGSGVRRTQGPPPPLVSGARSAAVPEAGAVLSGTEVSPPDLQPRSWRPATEFGVCFIRCCLWCGTFWEPLNLSHEASYCTYDRKCILISKGKGRFIWK